MNLILSQIFLLFHVDSFLLAFLLFKKTLEYKDWRLSSIIHQRFYKWECDNRSVEYNYVSTIWWHEYKLYNFLRRLGQNLSQSLLVSLKTNKHETKAASSENLLKFTKNLRSTK